MIIIPQKAYAPDYIPKLWEMSTDLLQKLAYSDTGLESNWAYILGEMTHLEDREFAINKQRDNFKNVYGSSDINELAYDMYFEVGPFLAEHNTIKAFLAEETQPILVKILPVISNIEEAIDWAINNHKEDVLQLSPRRQCQCKDLLIKLLQSEMEMWPLRSFPETGTELPRYLVEQ